MHFIIENNNIALEEICKSFNVKRLYVFGSASTGTFDEMQSDIDLIVELDQMDPLEKGETLMKLLDRFEQLFDRRVDLLSSAQVKNPYLQKGIDSTKQLIYEA
ncbi:MAG: nucleotidyltransferase domain-containing protein [Bacteroidales bacterium]|nr:nucleotidyltransferase domain-containing protein [Bacteroidales bacterium]